MDLVWYNHLIEKRGQFCPFDLVHSCSRSSIYVACFGHCIALSTCFPWFARFKDMFSNTIHIKLWRHALNCGYNFVILLWFAIAIVQMGYSNPTSEWIHSVFQTSITCEKTCATSL
jgi:hypothetical protein